MVLNHVTHLTRFIKITPTSFDPHFLGHGNLHVINHAVIPVIGKQRVSEAQGQQVENRFFT